MGAQAALTVEVQAIQKRSPRTHTIVEAHPDVHARMLALGWDRRPGVRILRGRWQDVLPGLGQRFDGVFFDTYSEYYGDMQCVPHPPNPHVDPWEA
jgi:protein arginine N-methyltransferase 2